jgi:hypothetical protein
MTGITRTTIRSEVSKESIVSIELTRRTERAQHALAVRELVNTSNLDCLLEFVDVCFRGIHTPSCDRPESNHHPDTADDHPNTPVIRHRSTPPPTSDFI